VPWGRTFRCREGWPSRSRQVQGAAAVRMPRAIWAPAGVGGTGDQVDALVSRRPISSGESMSLQNSPPIPTESNLTMPLPKVSWACMTVFLSGPRKKACFSKPRFYGEAVPFSKSSFGISHYPTTN